MLSLLTQNARVAELADSPDSGYSAHSGRAGSSLATGTGADVHIGFGEIHFRR